MKLSVLMPVYNEARTVEMAAKRLLDVEFPCDVELVVVDDGSSDGTAAKVRGMAGPGGTAGFQPVNRGKGAADPTPPAHTAAGPL